MSGLGSWTLEVIDEHGDSTVWDDGFKTDQAALDEVMRTIREEGIEWVISEAEDTTASSGTESNPLRLATPLSDEELARLDQFWVSGAISDETTLLDNLDEPPILADSSRCYVGSANMTNGSFAYSVELGFLVEGASARTVGWVCDAIREVSTGFSLPTA